MKFIKMFYFKDAEYNPTGKSGVYGGYPSREARPRRFSSLVNGQVDFKYILINSHPVVMKVGR